MNAPACLQTGNEWPGQLIVMLAYGMHIYERALPHIMLGTHECMYHLVLDCRNQKQSLNKQELHVM